MSAIRFQNVVFGQLESYPAFIHILSEKLTKPPLYPLALDNVLGHLRKSRVRQPTVMACLPQVLLALQNMISRRVGALGPIYHC